MRRLGFVPALVISLVATGQVARAQTLETVTANLQIGDNGTAIAQRFEAAWTLLGAFDCSSNANLLVVENTNAACNPRTTYYEFNIGGTGLLDQNHTMSLRIECAPGAADNSPFGYTPNVSMELDAGGFVTLVPGPNVFASGPDTITVTYGLTAPIVSSGLPMMPLWASVLFATLVLFAGGSLLKRAPVRRTVG